MQVKFVTIIVYFVYNPKKLRIQQILFAFIKSYKCIA